MWEGGEGFRVDPLIYFLRMFHQIYRNFRLEGLRKIRVVTCVRLIQKKFILIDIRDNFF